MIKTLGAILLSTGLLLSLAGCGKQEPPKPAQPEHPKAGEPEHPTDHPEHPKNSEHPEHPK